MKHDSKSMTSLLKDFISRASLMVWLPVFLIQTFSTTLTILGLSWLPLKLDNNPFILSHTYETSEFKFIFHRAWDSSYPTNLRIRVTFSSTDQDNIKRSWKSRVGWGKGTLMIIRISHTQHINRHLFLWIIKSA